MTFELRKEFANFQTNSEHLGEKLSEIDCNNCANVSNFKMLCSFADRFCSSWLDQNLVQYVNCLLINRIDYLYTNMPQCTRCLSDRLRNEPEIESLNFCQGELFQSSGTKLPNFLVPSEI